LELVLEHPRCRPCGGKDAPQMAMLAKYPSGGMTPPGGTVVRIDAGSAVSYTNSKGQVWSADTDSVGGATVNRGAITIANTTDLSDRALSYVGLPCTGTERYIYR